MKKRLRFRIVRSYDYHTPLMYIPIEEGNFEVKDGENLCEVIRKEFNLTSNTVIYVMD